MGNRILEGQNPTLLLGLLAYVGILLTHPNHDSFMLWSPDDRREHGSWCIIASESSLDHTRSIVAHDGGNLSFF
jgi:hypothetical protein